LKTSNCTGDVGDQGSAAVGCGDVQASSEQSKQLSKPEENNERANYLHHGAKLLQPPLVGLLVLAQPDDTKRSEKPVQANRDQNKTAPVQVHKSLLSVGPPTKKSHDTKDDSDRDAGDPKINRIQVSLLLIRPVSPVCNSSDANPD
jgi:hypothetical protein